MGCNHRLPNIMFWREGAVINSSDLFSYNSVKWNHMLRCWWVWAEKGVAPRSWNHCPSFALHEFQFGNRQNCLWKYNCCCSTIIQATASKGLKTPVCVCFPEGASTDISVVAEHVCGRVWKREAGAAGEATYEEMVILVPVSSSIFFRLRPSFPISRPTRLLWARIFRGMSSVLHPVNTHTDTHTLRLGEMMEDKFRWVSLMWCEECYGVMGMNRNVDSCPAGSAAGSTGHNVKTWAFYLVMCAQWFTFCCLKEKHPDVFKKNYLNPFCSRVFVLGHPKVAARKHWSLQSSINKGLLQQA